MVRSRLHAFFVLRDKLEEENANRQRKNSAPIFAVSGREDTWKGTTENVDGDRFRGNVFDPSRGVLHSAERCVVL